MIRLIMNLLINLPGHLLRLLIRVYQLFIAPMLGPRCRFHPSCSSYTAEAITRHGALGGIWLGITRILRCHPWSEGGFDPVPEKLSLNLTLGSKVHRSCCPDHSSLGHTSLGHTSPGHTSLDSSPSHTHNP